MDKESEPSSQAFFFKGDPTKTELKKGKRPQKFTCRLKAVRCKEISPITHKQCRRRTVIGTGYCWQHLLMFYHLRIEPSTIKKGDKSIGYGLFAAGPPGPVVFRKGEVVVYYGGDKCSEKTMNDRYGEFTAPYGLEVGKKGSEVGYDGACDRGVGNLVNHKPDLKANTRFSVTTVDGEKIPCLRASKSIRANQELFVDYGREYRMNGRLHGKHDTRSIHKGHPFWYYT